MRSQFRHFAVTCLLTASLFGSATSAEFYPVGSIDILDLPNGVSPDGTTVLTSRHTWTIAGGFADIPTDTSEIYTRDISDNGLIAGLWCGSNTGSCYEAFVSPTAGPGEGLGAFDNWASDAFAITPDGQVVVGHSSSTDGEQSFRWTSATGLLALGNLFPGANSHDTAFGVSADGSVVVGQSGDDMTLEAYRWTEGTGMLGLGDLVGGSFQSSALDVSATGDVIVGHSTGALGIEAFRWTEATGMTPLGDLPDGAFYSIAHATTADGSIVVGQASTEIGGAAFVWTATEGMRSLQEVLVEDYGLGDALKGWQLSSAADISHDGRVIVGQGINPTGATQGFAVVIPEPSGGALTTFGLLTIFASIGLRRRSTKHTVAIQLV